MKLNIKKLNPEAITPTRGHEWDAGADLYSLESRVVLPGEGYQFPTGIAANIPNEYYLQIATRSSMSKKGWVVVGGVIDSSYKGELSVMLRNISNEMLVVESGDKIAQLIMYPIAVPSFNVVEDIGTSTRGSGGWGSTGA